MRGVIDQAIATVRRDGDALSSKKLAGFFVRELDDDEDASGEASILGATEAVEDVEHAPAAEQSTVRLRNVNVRQLRCAREWRYGSRDGQARGPSRSQRGTFRRSR